MLNMNHFNSWHERCENRVSLKQNEYRGYKQVYGMISYSIFPRHIPLL